MNRIIKFRAWHKGAKQMLYGCNRDVWEWEQEAQPIEIMQFTGLKDKKGVEIYEGDILRGEGRISGGEKAGHRYLTVKWLDNYVIGFNVHGKSKHLWEIIGNIFEHPELLKGK